MSTEYIRSFISKVYTQASHDFIERFKPAIVYESLSNEEIIKLIIVTCKELTDSEFEWFSFWYLV